ncbi:PKD domain-containing protein [Nocardioides aestuarii]|uniref:PKD domain-containing protein n=1 Tax=Nocardioides aestuarii TaxID=252231 RepID=A0ABW4TIU7_9ACTN
MVRRAFERLSWPTSELQLQPPDGQTLINFDTNFFTDNTAPTTRSVTLLGQQVEIEATPSGYTWDFGDGASRTTSSPGAAYPDLDVTHEYASEGRVSPSVATTYQGRYRINGGGWQQIPGTLTLPGEPEALRVRSASPRLVGTASY